MVLAVSSLAFIPLLYVTSFIARPLFRVLRRVYYFILTEAAGITIRIEGERYVGKRTLYVANHISYLDVIALGRFIPASFIAKSDVNNWPLINVVARAAGTLFIERKTMFPFSELCVVKKKLYRVENLILFPEGTTSDGNQILKFKSSLFRIAEEAQSNKKIAIQPVTIAYTGIDGRKTSAADRTSLAWYGEMTFLPHLWYVLKLSEIEITLNFHPVKVFTRPTCRKLVTYECRQVMEEGFINQIAT